MEENDLPADYPLKDSTMENENRRKWHVGREIPVATLLVLVMQTAGVVWWAASTSARVDYMKEAAVTSQIVQAAIDRRQDDDSQRSEARIIVQLDRINAKLDMLTEKSGWTLGQMRRSGG